MNSISYIIVCLVLIFPSEIKGLRDRTLNDAEMVKFCESKDPEVKRGYRHPHYCSKAIFCVYKSSKGRNQDEISFEEYTCPKCTNSKRENTKQNEDDCPFGHEHWDETKQKCRMANEINCRQEELSKVKAWGQSDLASYCPKDTGFSHHPHHCGKFLYCERDKVYRDLYVEVRNCPECTKHETTCPEGYEYHISGGSCAFPDSIKDENVINRCRQSKVTEIINNNNNNDKTTTVYTPVSAPKPPLKSDDILNDDFVIIPEGANRTELAEKFCQNKTAEPIRYPHPDSCHKYIFCWFGLYDKDGDLRDKNTTFHLEFECSTCEVDPTTCPLGVKVFDPKSSECKGANVAAKCNINSIPNNNNLQATTLEPEWSRKSLLNESEVMTFCRGKNLSRDYLHPSDKTCTRYITCWFQQNFFEEKSCEPCDPQQALDCPSGYLHFDERVQECRSASNSSCIPEKIPELPKNITISSNYSMQKPAGLANSEILLHAKPCNPRDYVQRGYCKTYFKCDRKKRHEDMKSCSGRLFWNPDRNSIHGGVCDYLKNIDNYTLYQYKKDPGCVLNVAYFRADDKPCSGTYFYNHPKRTEGKEVKLQCPEDLLWTKVGKTCAKCRDVTRHDGGLCCDEDSDVDHGTLLSSFSHSHIN